MSHILEAIRKAEKQRQSTRVPTLESAMAGEDEAAKFRFRAWFWPVLLVSILTAVGILYRAPLTVEVQSCAAAVRDAVIAWVASGSDTGRATAAAHATAALGDMLHPAQTHRPRCATARPP